MTGAVAVLRNGVNNVAGKAPPLAGGGDCASIYCNGDTFGGACRSLGRYLFAQITAQLRRGPALPIGQDAGAEPTSTDP